jgi:hypothetical protein
MIGFLGRCIRRFSCIFFHAVEQSLAINTANIKRKEHGGWGPGGLINLESHVAQPYRRAARRIFNWSDYRSGAVKPCDNVDVT